VAPAHTARIQQISAEALLIETPADIERIVRDFRATLEEHIFRTNATLRDEVSSFKRLDEAAPKSLPRPLPIRYPQREAFRLLREYAETLNAYIGELENRIGIMESVMERDPDLLARYTQALRGRKRKEISPDLQKQVVAIREAISMILD
jgi:hypothetical protein